MQLFQEHCNSSLGYCLTYVVFYATPVICCSNFVVASISAVVSAEFVCGCDDPGSEDFGKQDHF